MPTVFSHAIAGAALGAMFPPGHRPVRYWLAGAACAMLPDADVFGFWLGIPWGHVLAHRGLTHSLPFAACLAAAVIPLAFRDRPWDGQRGQLWLFLFLATASQGVLDAMTDGGPGVAFLAPFDDTRYFLPWRPIRVSPISLERFLSQRGLHVLQSEMLWVWLPAAALVAVGMLAGRRRR